MIQVAAINVCAPWATSHSSHAQNKLPESEAPRAYQTADSSLMMTLVEVAAERKPVEVELRMFVQLDLQQM